MSVYGACADNFPAEWNIVFTIAGKKFCDVDKQDFALQTTSAYELWKKRHTQEIENAKIKLGGEKKFLALIDNVASDPFAAFGTGLSIQKDKVPAYCKEVSEWLLSPLD